jgi:hypothetical protein
MKLYDPQELTTEQQARRQQYHKALSDAQFKNTVILYRGLESTTPDQVYSPLGQHWTSDKSVAEEFATHGFNDGDEDAPKSEWDGVGTVLTAKVRKKHIIKPGSDEYYGIHEVLEPEDEHEHPIRKGAKVNLVQVEEHRLNPRGITKKDKSKGLLGKKEI